MDADLEKNRTTVKGGRGEGKRAEEKGEGAVARALLNPWTMPLHCEHWLARSEKGLRDRGTSKNPAGWEANKRNKESQKVIMDAARQKRWRVQTVINRHSYARQRAILTQAVTAEKGNHSITLQRPSRELSKARRPLADGSSYVALLP